MMRAADTITSLQTPEGIEFVLYPAGIPIRACAWAIDGLIQGVFLFALVLADGLLGRVLGIWFLLIMVFVLDWFYHTLFEVFNKGQSPGKRIMGVMVVCADGSPVNPGSSFLRNLLRFADTFLFLYLIVFICMLVSPGFRRLGDWVADTLVVYVAHARSPLRRPGMPHLADFPKLFPSRKLDHEEKQAIMMFARRYPLLGKARADEIAKIWTDDDSSASEADSKTEASASETSASAQLLGIARNLDGG